MGDVGGVVHVALAAGPNFLCLDPRRSTEFGTGHRRLRLSSAILQKPMRIRSWDFQRNPETKTVSCTIVLSL